MTPVVSVEAALEVIDRVGTPMLIGVSGTPAGAGHVRLLYVAPIRRSCGLTLSRADESSVSATFVDKSATKGDALRLVMGRLGVTQSGTLAVGDSEVDLSMFEVAGVRVAVRNADAQVRAAADATAPLDRGRGVAWAIDYFLATDRPDDSPEGGRA